MRKLLIAFAMVIVLIAVPMSGSAADGTVIYDNTASPLPGNLVSEGFEATQTSELGDEISFAGTSHMLQQVTVTMSSWACESGSWNNHDCVTTPGATFQVPITFTIYNVADGNAVGTPIAHVTQTFDIPYRPSADDVNCTGADAGKWYSNIDGKCDNGLATNITFDFSSAGVTLPDSVIYGISYNTSSYGDDPIGVSGPYDSLNVGLNNESAPTVGTDVNPDAVFWNTSTASNYTDGGAGGVGTFRQDTGWAGFVPAVRFTATVPAPTSKDQCKAGGWQQFDNPHFKNQGDCVQFVNTGK
jgi:hypothetical protein